MAHQSHRKQRRRQASRNAASGQDVLFYGRHAVEAALKNERRRIHTLYADKAFLDKARQSRSDFHSAAFTADIAAQLPRGAVHQSVAAHVSPLEQPALEAFLSSDPSSTILILDQVTDPQNVGAIFRSAAGFGAGAVVMQDKHAPGESGALARAASGALELLPWIAVTNLSRTLSTLAEAGYWCVGLDGTSDSPLEAAVANQVKLCLVLGAEGA
ncbi:MAG: RNA methyltransferase, partial [Pseudomonadota bacterium]